MTYKHTRMDMHLAVNALKKSLDSFGALLNTENLKNQVIGRPNPRQAHLQPLVKMNFIQNLSIGLAIRSSETEKMVTFTSQTNARKPHRTAECILCSMVAMVTPITWEQTKATMTLL